MTSVFYGEPMGTLSPNILQPSSTHQPVLIIVPVAFCSSRPGCKWSWRQRPMTPHWTRWPWVPRATCANEAPEGHSMDMDMAMLLLSLSCVLFSTNNCWVFCVGCCWLLLVPSRYLVAAVAVVTCCYCQATSNSKIQGLWAPWLGVPVTSSRRPHSTKRDPKDDLAWRLPQR